MWTRVHAWQVEVVMVFVLLCSLLAACLYGGFKMRHVFSRRLRKVKPPPTSSSQSGWPEAPRELNEISLNSRRLSRRASRSGAQVLVDEEPEGGEEEGMGPAEEEGPPQSSAPQVFDRPRV